LPKVSNWVADVGGDERDRDVRAPTCRTLDADLDDAVVSGQLDRLDETGGAVRERGVGDLDPTIPLANGAVAPATPISLAASPVNIHVDIDGQPAVITYAGTSPGAVAGLVQINAIVPPSARAAVVPITVSIGAAASSRRSQPGVTMAVSAK